jgi:hypothetical protein
LNKEILKILTNQKTFDENNEIHKVEEAAKVRVNFDESLSENDCEAY